MASRILDILNISHRLMWPPLTVPGVAGTSCAAPTFSGVISLVNDRRLAAGKSSLGFLNPFLVGHRAREAEGERERERALVGFYGLLHAGCLVECGFPPKATTERLSYGSCFLLLHSTPPTRSTILPRDVMAGVAVLGTVLRPAGTPLQATVIVSLPHGSLVFLAPRSGWMARVHPNLVSVGSPNFEKLLEAAMKL